MYLKEFYHQFWWIGGLRGGHPTVNGPRVFVPVPSGPAVLAEVDVLRHLIARIVADRCAWVAPREERLGWDEIKAALVYAGDGLYRWTGPQRGNPRPIRIALNANPAEACAEPGHHFDLLWVINGDAGTDGVGGDLDLSTLWGKIGPGGSVDGSAQPDRAGAGDSSASPVDNGEAGRTGDGGAKSE